MGASDSQLPSRVWGHKDLPACGVRGLSTMKAAPDPDSPWAFLDPDEVEFMEDDDGVLPSPPPPLLPSLPLRCSSYLQTNSTLMNSC